MVIDSKITVHIKTDKKGENVVFQYKRKDLKPLEETNAKLLVMYAEGIIRNIIEKGLIVPPQKEKKDEQ